MHEFNIALLSVGLLVLAVGLLSETLKRQSLLSETLLALAAGVMLGPLGFGWLRPEGWGDSLAILEEVTRLTLALSLMTTALRLPVGYFRQHWRAAALLLGVIMPLMWLMMGALGAALLGVPLLSAALIGAVVTPTDPVIASAIVSGETAKNNIPARLRHLLSAESGANDGLAYPLVTLPILLLTTSTGQALTSWAWRVIGWEVLGAALMGALIGWAGGRVLRRARPGETDAIHLTSVAAIAFVALSGSKLLGTDGVFAVFVAGMALKHTHPQLAETQNTQEALNRFFVLPVFVLLGLMLPWSAWLDLGWPGLLLALGALLLRRLPLVLALRTYIKPLHCTRDAFLIGWFGPIGVGALFYAALAVRQSGNMLPWAVGSLLVVVSVVAHGLSATPFTRWFGAAQRRDDQKSNAVNATGPPVRES